MTTSKKTVKELNVVVEALENKMKQFDNLAKLLENCDIQGLLEKVKKIDIIEEELKVLGENVPKTGQQESDLEGRKTFNCRICKQEFSRKKQLKVHVTENHPIQIECNICTVTFIENWKYEMHIKEHDQVKQFKCDECEHSFYSAWRLNQHTKSHKETNQKHCHYFNNHKLCPYEELGCKFKHSWSEKCKYLSMCNNKLCQYQHDSMRREKENNIGKNYKCEELNFMDEVCKFKTSNELRFANHIKANHDLGENYQCDDCDYATENRKNLMDHIKENHNKEYIMCDGNCRDRLYEENCFNCEKCKEELLCTVCSRADSLENLCWGCA